jgi:hypothetical protein
MFEKIRQLGDIRRNPSSLVGGRSPWVHLNDHMLVELPYSGKAILKTTGGNNG